MTEVTNSGTIIETHEGMDTEVAENLANICTSRAIQISDEEKVQILRSNNIPTHLWAMAKDWVPLGVSSPEKHFQGGRPELYSASKHLSVALW